MKIRIYLKDPDTLYDAISDSVENIQTGLSAEATEKIKEAHKEEYIELSRTWFEYGEYVMLEMDTEAKTCIVIPVKDHLNKNENI